MNAFLKDILIRKLQEASTWAGIVTLVCGAIGWNASPEVRDAIVQVAVPLIGLLMVLVNERKGPNPLNAPLPTDSVVRDESKSPKSVEVPAIHRSDLPPDKRGNDVVEPRPIRPGFN